MEHLLFLVKVQTERSSPLIANFLHFPFKSKKLSPRTIEGYKTAIAGFLKFHAMENFSDNIFLDKLIKSFKSEAPIPKNIFFQNRTSL